MFIRIKTNVRLKMEFSKIKAGIKSFILIFKNKILGIEQLVDPETRQKRLSLCRDCQHYEPVKKTCKQCGCFLELKTRYSHQSCPLDKW